MSDGRPGQGRDHPVAAVLALAAAAVVAGSRSFTAIASWAADVPARQPGIPDRAARHRPGRHAAAGIAALGVSSLDTTRASPPAIAGLVRGQWAIEFLHWLRDTLYREDNSTVRTRSGPRATLRNLALGAFHLAGRHDTTEATCWASRNMGRPLTIPGLTSRSLLRRGQPLARGRTAVRKLDSTRSDAR